jgi:diamine N-acetyltransferase
MSEFCILYSIHTKINSHQKKSAMNISLRKIDESNWRECIKLKVRDDQMKFVASNENGLALAYAHKEMEPRGIYSDEEIVGFIMYARDPDDGIHYINRLMIDVKHQGRGFGTEALRILLRQLRNAGVNSVDILHKPDNYSAIRIYEKLGFILTDEKLGDDVISTVDLTKTAIL